MPNPIKEDYLGEMGCCGIVILHWISDDDSRLNRLTVVLFGMINLILLHRERSVYIYSVFYSGKELTTCT
jgi:hypothetical protein